jgi:hypothetical protein
MATVPGMSLNKFLLIFLGSSLSLWTASAELEGENDDPQGNSKKSTGILVQSPRESDRSENAAKDVDIRHLMGAPREVEEEKVPEKKEKTMDNKPSAADRRGF